MGLIATPLPKPEEERVARDMNRLFNLFLPEVRRAIKAEEPECIWVREPEVVYLFYGLQKELAELQDLRVVGSTNNEADFWPTERVTIWTTEAWLLLLALEFKTSGKTLMVNDLMKELFPKIFAPSIIYGRDAIEILKRVEAKLPSGREIPEEAEELLMLL